VSSGVVRRHTAQNPSLVSAPSIARTSTRTTTPNTQGNISGGRQSTRVQTGTPSPSPQTNYSNAAGTNQSAADQLAQMGFDRTQISEALFVCNGDKDKALAYLLN